MKLVIALGIGFGVIIFIALLRSLFSRRNVPAVAVVKLEEPGVPWFSIGVLRLLRILVGVLAILVAILTLRWMLFGFAVTLDTGSSTSGWKIAFYFVLKMMPLLTVCWIAGALRDKINSLYRDGARTRELLIATRWHF